MSAEIVAISLMSIIALSLPGFILTKAKLITHSSLGSFSNMLLYVTMPVLTFINFQDMAYSPELIKNLFCVAGLGALFLGGSAIIASLIIKPKTASFKAKVIAYASICPNCAFIGIPLLQALYPGNPEPIVYCAMLSGIFNICVFTLFAYLMSGDSSYISVKKALLNPSTVSVLISLPLFIFGIKIIDFMPSIYNVMGLLGNCTTPFAMTILGIRLANMTVKEIFCEKSVYISNILRLVIIPLIVFLILQLFKGILDSLVIEVMFILLSMPTATMAVVFSEKIYNDGKLAASGFVSSTLISIVTIPLLLMLI